MQERIDETFEALSDPHRISIVEMLREEPRPVREIADRLPISRPAVSRHLRVLKSAGIVEDTAAGTRRVYSLRPEALAEARKYLEELWSTALSRFEAEADRDDG